MKGLRIGIVGGSVTGCAVAALAARSGHHPRVFERSSEPLRDRGAGLAVPSGVCLEMGQHGLLTHDVPHVPVRALEHVSRDSAGEAGSAGRVPTAMEAIRWGDLYAHLRSLVPAATYAVGSAVESVEERGVEVAVRLAGGRTHEFDLVVFADGYRSLGRPLVSPDSAPQYEGYFIWRGTVPEAEVSGDIDFGETLQRVGFPGGHLFAYTLPSSFGSIEPGAREVNWGMYLPLAADELPGVLTGKDGVQYPLAVPPGLLRAEVEAAFQARARALLPSDFAAMVAATRDTFGQGVVTVTPDRYRNGRLCLAGDAGALVPPYTTSGVFKGMRNALELVQSLSPADDVDMALQSWDAAQRAGAQRLASLGRLMAEKLIQAVPDFSQFEQADLDAWWADIQAELVVVMGR